MDASIINIMDEKSYNSIKANYVANACWGLSCSLDVKECEAVLIRSKDAIQQFVIQLCDLIQMKRFEGTNIVNFGEDEKVAGFSMVQLIETSLISGHFANLTNSAYIDIFSCKPYNPHVAGEFTRKFFMGKEVNVQVSYRK